MKAHIHLEVLLSWLIFLLLGIVMSGPIAAQQKSVSTPSPPPAALKPTSNTGADEADLFWRSREKHFLVVAASKTAGIGKNLPFTKVDGQLVSQTFIERGYEKLDILDDKRATRDNFVKQLQRIREFPENAMVVVYYSGHAVKDPQEKDLWLQLYGQAEFGDHYGLSLSELIGAARGNTYKGDLVIILDSCYSGQGTLTSQLSLRETDKTIIFASSATYQQSYWVKLRSGIEISAFTYYLLQGLGSDWVEVDADSDGIIFYNDLQTYIENELLELLRDKAILGPMQPQLFGQSPKIWAAYDARQVRNLETQARKNLRLQRLFQLQDPDKLRELLSGPLPPNADAYLRAIQAINGDQFDEAWHLLEMAEREKKVPLAEIYWARAGVKAEQGEIGNARGWLEKALAASPQQNVDLIEQTAGINLTLGNWTRAEELFKQVLDLMGEGKEDKEDVTISLFALTMMNILQGDRVEAELYLKRLKRVDAKVLEDQEEGLSNIIPFLEIVSDVLQDKKESARRKIEELRKSLATTKGEMQEALRSLIQIIDVALNATVTEASNVTAWSADKLREWDEVLHNKNVNRMILLLNQLQIAVSGSATADSLRSPQVESLLKRTVDFARQHKLEKQKLIVQTQTGTSEIEIANSEKQSVIESATLLTGAAIIYSARQEAAEAEKLLKEAIALEEEEKQGIILAMNPLMRLGELYENAGRLNDAESLYRNTLDKLREPLGEQNFYSYMMYKNLGDLYKWQERWAEAEKSYRSCALLSQSTFGSDNILGVDGQETLASFFIERGRYAEAVPLFEQVIDLLERKQKTAPLLYEDSLGNDYFKLAQSYYYLRQYGAAERGFQRAADIFSSRKEPDLVDNFSCLGWQWFMARALNKSDEASLFYQKAVKLVESDLAQPHPNESLGSTLQAFASSFRDTQAYAEAEQLLRLALSIQEKVYSSQHLEVAKVWEALADLSDARKQYGDTLASLKMAQGIYEKQSPPNIEKLSFVFYRMGFASYNRQEFKQARNQLQQAVDLLQQVQRPLRISDNYAKFFLGRVQRILGQYAAAKTNLKAVLEEDEHAQQLDALYILADLLELTAISRSESNRAEAEQWLIRAQTALEKILPSESINRGWARLAHEKGMLALANGKVKKAEQLLREAIEKGEKDPQMDIILLTEFMDDYAVVLRQRSKEKEAAQVEQHAKQIRDSSRSGR